MSRQTAKRTWRMSPSRTSYSLPSTRTLPACLATSIEPAATSSSYEITSARMKPRSRSVWIAPAASGALAPLRTSQARVSSSPVVRNVIRSIARYSGADHGLEPGLVDPELVQERPRLCGVHLRRLRLDRGVHADRPLRQPRGHLGALLEVRDDDRRLDRERRDRLELAAVLLGQPGVRERDLGLQGRVRRAERVDLGGRLATRPLLGLLERRLDHGLVREQQIGPDLCHLGRRLRVGPEAPDHDRERVRLAQLRNRLRRGRPTRDVDEPDLRVHGLARTLHLGQDVDPGVGDGHDRVVRLPTVTAGPRERREQGRLPAEGKADQTDVLHAFSLGSGPGPNPDATKGGAGRPALPRSEPMSTTWSPRRSCRSRRSSPGASGPARGPAPSWPGPPPSSRSRTARGAAGTSRGARA